MITVKLLIKKNTNRASCVRITLGSCEREHSDPVNEGSGQMRLIITAGCSVAVMSEQTDCSGAD